ncbi:MAG: hypothetical protein D9V47_02865 [Clostridia bacterium]|nr:MAG: hypothetical protein D9V47_02865 [Clostridia bacterium]
MFRASEVIEIAVAMERNGRALYQAMAAAAASPKVKDLLDKLAAAETQHITDFSTLGRQFENYAPPESYPGEYEDYVKALVDAGVFARDLDPKELVGQCTTDEAILDLALNFEKETIIFFHTFPRLVFSPEEQKAVSRLIREEEEHIVQLSAAKRQRDAKA